MSTSHDAERPATSKPRSTRWTSTASGSPPTTSSAGPRRGAADDPDIARVDLIRHHAGTLVDLGTGVAHPFAATRSHALTVRNELIEFI